MAIEFGDQLGPQVTPLPPAARNGGPSSDAKTITISPPNFQRAILSVVGTAPYVQARFGEKAQRQMAEQMQAGSTAKKGRKREPRDFDADYEAAMHRDAAGRHGIPAPAFRNAAIDACRMAGFQMTRAKMSVFIEHDTVDAVDGQPLVLIEGTVERLQLAVRNKSGVADLRVRPMWREWHVRLTVRYDADQFTESDVVNLFHRAGLQVGIGEGRPFSKESNGLGYGTFTLASSEEVAG
jgi:hypothetical protein